MQAILEAELPIKGLGYSIVPYVHKVEENLFEKNLYAQNNGLEILQSPAVNKVAKAVKPEKPTKQFLDYAREHSKYNEDYLLQLYNQVHNYIWGRLGYWIRSKEILALLPAKPSIHPRIISSDYYRRAIVKLIKDYKVVEDDVYDYKIDINVITPNPIIKVNWLRENGRITPEMAGILGANINTRVWIDTISSIGEGLRSLDWRFLDGETRLSSNDNPWDRYSGMGSLLGKKI